MIEARSVSCRVSGLSWTYLRNLSCTALPKGFQFLSYIAVEKPLKQNKSVFIVHNGDSVWADPISKLPFWDNKAGLTLVDYPQLLLSYSLKLHEGTGMTSYLIRPHGYTRSQM